MQALASTSACLLFWAASKRRRKALAIKRVGPGDLITADFLNQIIDEVNRLSQAVAALEHKRHPAKKRKRKAASEKRIPKKRI
jgi:hypothetical protein